MAVDQQKLFIGPRIRRMRRKFGLTQSAMAEELAISPSYLNLIERNQRPLSAQLLLRLSETYDLDLKELGGGDTQLEASLIELFRDPLFTESNVTRADIIELADSSPEISGALITLYHTYRQTVENVATAAERAADAGQVVAEALSSPMDEARDFFHDHNNHFPDLEDAAEALRKKIPVDGIDLHDGLRAYLKDQYGITVRIWPSDTLGHILRRFDRHGNRLFLSEMLGHASRTFHMAYQIGVMENRERFDAIVGASNLRQDTTEQICRGGLANYFAGAVLMPYDQFFDDAEALRYDVDILAQRFGASLEQVYHRLTTLQRPGKRGVPFFFIRVDRAGNISKRFSASSFPFARFGGTCPRWNLHDVFSVPGRMETQVLQLEDGTTYFALSRTVYGTAAGHHASQAIHAIGLGCEISFASRLVYADGLDLAHAANITPIGLNCRLCERSDCNERAYPPVNRRVEFDDNFRGYVPFSFDAP